MLRRTDEQALTDAIKDAFPSMEAALCADRARSIIEKTDERLEENVGQWMRKEPLSEIWIGRYCVGMVMSIRGDNSFLEALEALSLYGSNPSAGERRIWRTRQ